MTRSLYKYSSLAEQNLGYDDAHPGPMNLGKTETHADPTNLGEDETNAASECSLVGVPLRRVSHRGHVVKRGDVEGGRGRVLGRLTLLASTLVASLLIACGGTGEKVSSESHWVMCSVDEQCFSYEDAAGCGSEGFCVDALSQRVEVEESSSDVGSVQAGDARSCDPLSAPVVAPLELGSVIAAGEDASGTAWVLDYVPDPDAPSCSALNHLCSPTELRAFRREGDELIRMRLWYDFADNLELFWPELFGDYTEVLQVKLTEDTGIYPPPDTPQGLVVLATADGEVEMGSYEADILTKPEAPIADESQMTETFTLVEAESLGQLDIVNFEPRSGITRHAGFVADDNTAYVLLVTTPESNESDRRVFFGTTDSLIQRRIERYAVAGDGGTTQVHFWVDGEVVEAFLPVPVNPLSGLEEDPTITLQGEEIVMTWIEGGADTIATYEPRCPGW